MRFRKFAAGILAAAVAATSSALPADIFSGIGLSVVSEAASTLPAPKVTRKTSTVSSVTLYWDAVAGASGYKLYMYNTDKQKYVLIATMTKTSCKVVELSAGVTYKFMLTAYVEKNGTRVNQTFTGKISATTQKLSAPKNTSAKVSGTTATLSWSEVKGADCYRVYMYDSSSEKLIPLKSVLGTQLEVKGLKQGKTYYYKVAALVKYGSSYFVQTQSAYFKATVPSASSAGTSPSSTATPAKFTGTDITVYDGSGNKVKLSDYAAGMPVILNLWATWCPPCRAELPYFEKYYKQYGDKIKFMMIDSYEDEDQQSSVKKFLKDNSYTFPVYYDYDYSADKAYGSDAIPMTIILDKNGKVIESHRGRLEESELKALIDKIL